MEIEERYKTRTKTIKKRQMGAVLCDYKAATGFKIGVWWADGWASADRPEDDAGNPHSEKMSQP